jgi:F-type H+-transporting ATPase subunit b
MVRIILLVTALMMAAVPLALAGGGGEKTGWDAWSTVVYQGLNLLILLWLIVKFAGPPVRAGLDNRSKRISQDIDEAARLHEEARTLLAEYEARLSSFSAQSEEILADSRALGQAERERIIADAEAEAERIKSEAERVASSDRKRALESLEAEIVDRAIARAEAAIKEKLTTDDHHALVTDYFGQLETSIQKS